MKRLAMIYATRGDPYALRNVATEMTEFLKRDIDINDAITMVATDEEMSVRILEMDDDDEGGREYRSILLTKDGIVAEKIKWQDMKERW